MTTDIDCLLAQVRSCRICRETTERRALPHEPRPVLQISTRARIVVCGQAPGTRVHASGRPFTDPSGDRLRDWMGVDDAMFYDPARIAIVPMGFCFPGLDAKGGDLPPRPECAKAWRSAIFASLANVRLIMAVGAHAVRWHLGQRARRNLTDTVADWRAYADVPLWPGGEAPLGRVFPMPHPSWRNNAWLKDNPWFERELVPVLRADLRNVLDGAS